jgi:hypothetical protein
MDKLMNRLLDIWDVASKVFLALVVLVLLALTLGAFLHV